MPMKVPGIHQFQCQGHARSMASTAPGTHSHEAKLALLQYCFYQKPGAGSRYLVLKICPWRCQADLTGEYIPQIGNNNRKGGDLKKELRWRSKGPGRLILGEAFQKLLQGQTLLIWCPEQGPLPLNISYFCNNSFFCAHSSQHPGVEDDHQHWPKSSAVIRVLSHEEF